MYKNTKLTDFDLQSFNYEERNEDIPVVIENLEISVEKLTSNTGKRMFLIPNVFNRVNGWPEVLDIRQSPVITRFPFTDIDSIHFYFPKNLHIEVMPENIIITSRFGEYKAQYLVDEDGITYIRKFIWKDGEFPSESYDELVSFLKNISNADAAKIVLLNST